jgi:hypothetical protein
VTQPLFEAIEFIGLECQGYMLTGAYGVALESEPRNPLAQWPEPLTEAETSVPWVSLRLKRDQSLAPWRWPKSWSLDFSTFTPEKFR